MNLRGKLLCGFLAVLAVSSIGFGIVFYDSEKVMVDITTVRDEEIPRLEKISNVVQNTLTKAVRTRGFVITGNEAEFNEYRRVSEENVRILTELVAISRTEERKRNFQEILLLDKEHTDIVENQIAPLIRAGRKDEAVAIMLSAAKIFTRSLEISNGFKQIYTGLAQNALDDAVAASRHVVLSSMILGIVSIILGVIIALYSSRSISDRVSQVAKIAQEVADGDLTDSYRGATGKDEIGKLATALNTMVANLKHMVVSISTHAHHVAASSEELTASADQLAQVSQQVAGSLADITTGSSDQLESVKATNNVVEDIVAELEEVASNVSLAADKTAKAAEMAAAGGQSATKAINQMNELEKTVSASARVVAQLGDRSKEIGQIVDTITGIAGQTNLLALNAAIEAARAGEQGRGFAVVAEEVRKLAEQSQEASKKIAELIGEVQAETSRAVDAMENGTHEVKLGAEVVNETGLSFQEIIDLVNQVSGQMSGIAQVVQKIAQGSKTVVSSVNNINAISQNAAEKVQTVSAATEEQSASMQEIASASQSLAKLSQDMQLTVEKFRV